MSDNTAVPINRGVLLSDDLIFCSRVTGTAEDLGLRMRTAPSLDRLMDLVRAEPPGCVIVDLGNPGLDIARLAAEIRQVCDPSPRLVAYGSHVDTAALDRARAAGCSPVLPRSKFVAELPRALPQWLTGAP